MGPKSPIQRTGLASMAIWNGIQPVTIACIRLWVLNYGSQKMAGVSWALVHDFGGDKIISVKVSPRDRNRIYVSHKQSGSVWRIHRSMDAGQTWELASPTPGENGNNSNQPIYLDVDGTNPDQLWCVLTGNQNGHKILSSSDAGETWADWSTETVATERVVSLVHQRGSNGGVLHRNDAGCLLSRCRNGRLDVYTIRGFRWLPSVHFYRRITVGDTSGLREPVECIRLNFMHLLKSNQDLWQIGRT